MAGRIVLAVLAFSVVLLKFLSLIKVIPTDAALEGWLLIAAGAVVFAQSIGGIAADVRAGAKQTSRHDAEKAILASLKTISSTTGVDILYLGGSVYLANRKDKLKRVVRYRLSDLPQPSDVKWTAGKGVIGTAWQQKKISHKDWSRVAGRWGNTEISQEQFDKLPKETRSGFDRTEFIGIVGKYSEILGVPIWNEGQTKCIGIYAVDIPMGLEHENIGRCLNTAAIHEVASSCAAVLSNVFGKK